MKKKTQKKMTAILAGVMAVVLLLGLVASAITALV
jgi:hypothetical protein